MKFDDQKPKKKIGQKEVNEAVQNCINSEHVNPLYFADIVSASVYEKVKNEKWFIEKNGEQKKEGLLSDFIE